MGLLQKFVLSLKFDNIINYNTLEAYISPVLKLGMNYPDKSLFIFIPMTVSNFCGEVIDLACLYFRQENFHAQVYLLIVVSDYFVLTTHSGIEHEYIVIVHDINFFESYC